MDRNQIIASFFDISGLGLEIGPSYNPIVPKSSGARIETVDHTDRAGLIKKYKNHANVDIERVETVDFVTNGQPMSAVIPFSERYDYIIASHVVEHTPNLLGFLQDCARLLRVAGVLVLVVPDRRYCFDFFRPATSTGDILQAHREKRVRHTAGALFDHLAYAARRGGKIAWSAHEEGKFELVHSLDEAGGLLLNYNAEGPYEDCHAWQFTPSRFRLVLSDLNGIGLLHLREHAFHDTVGCEFFVVLSRAGAGCPLDRLTLAEMALSEETAVGLRAQQRPVAPPVPPRADAVTPAEAERGTRPVGRKWAPPGIRRLKKALKRVGRAARI
jgi:predicted SAM-dependent methyltransferase